MTHVAQPVSLREVIASHLQVAGRKGEIPIARVVAGVRASLPDRRLNDAELIHLIAEGARQRGCTIRLHGE